MKVKKDRVILGTLGALIGSILGAVCILLEGRTTGGFSIICGMVMAVCTMQGYTLLGGQLSKRGAVISLGIMAVMIAFANYVNCTLEIMETVEELHGMDFLEVLGRFGELLEVQKIRSWYNWQLVLLYMYTLGSSLPLVIRTFRKPAEEQRRKTPESTKFHEKSNTKKSELQGSIYPFLKTWMNPMRLSVGIPVLVLIVALLVPLLELPKLEEHFQVDLGPGVLAGIVLSLIPLLGITLKVTRLCNSFQILYVRAQGKLWRVNLMKFCRVGDWEALPNWRREVIQDDIFWELENIMKGDFTACSSGAITELRGIQAEKENRWSWTVSYETDVGTRKKLEIPKGYPEFAPVVGMERAQEPVPCRWMPSLVALILTAAFLGGGIAVSQLWMVRHKPEQPLETAPIQEEVDVRDVPVRVPESIIEYEMSEVWFRMDADFQYSRRTFLDGDTGTVYRAYIQYDVDASDAWDTLSKYISEYRTSTLYDRFDAVYLDEEPLTPLDESSKYNIVSVYLTDGKVIHTAAVLSSDGTLFTIEAVSSAQSTEEVLANLMFTLKSVRFAGPVVTGENYQSQIHISEVRDCSYVAAAYLKTDLFGHDAFVDVYVPYSDSPIYSADGRAIRTEAHGLRVYATILPGENAKEVIDARHQELAATGRIYEEGVEDESYREDLDAACKLTVYEENGQKRQAILYADCKWDGYYLFREITGLPESVDEEYPALLKELEGIIGLTMPALEELGEK